MLVAGLRYVCQFISIHSFAQLGKKGSSIIRCEAGGGANMASPSHLRRYVSRVSRLSCIPAGRRCYVVAMRRDVILECETGSAWVLVIEEYFFCVCVCV